jgi:hypothetical protein
VATLPFLAKLHITGLECTGTSWLSPGSWA